MERIGDAEFERLMTLARLAGPPESPDSPSSADPAGSADPVPSAGSAGSADPAGSAGSGDRKAYARAKEALAAFAADLARAGGGEPEPGDDRPACPLREDVPSGEESDGPPGGPTDDRLGPEGVRRIAPSFARGLVRTPRVL